MKENTTYLNNDILQAENLTFIDPILQICFFKLLSKNKDERRTKNYNEVDLTGSNVKPKN